MKERDGKNGRGNKIVSNVLKKKDFCTLSSFFPSEVHAVSLDTIMVKSFSLENNVLLHLRLQIMRNPDGSCSSEGRSSSSSPSFSFRPERYFNKMISSFSSVGLRLIINFSAVTNKQTKTKEIISFYHRKHLIFIRHIAVDCTFLVTYLIVFIIWLGQFTGP